MSNLAISLGSCFRGFYSHCGFLAEWESIGEPPLKIAGTSSGAYTGLLHVCGHRGDALVDFILQPGITRSFLDLSILWRFPGIATWTFGTGFFSANRAVKFLKQRLDSPRLEDFKNPCLQVAVTDLASRQSLIAEEGDAVEHVIASCSVPGLFAARRLGQRLLWDGAIANDVPFHHWVSDPAVQTIVLHTIEHEQGTNPALRWNNMAMGVGVAHQVVSDLLNRYRKELAELHGKRLIHAVTRTPHPGLLRPDRDALVEAGRASARWAVKELKRANIGYQPPP